MFSTIYVLYIYYIHTHILTLCIPHAVTIYRSHIFLSATSLCVYRMMAKLRGGSAELGVEIGRWHGLRREDRVCKECGNGEVEDTEYFVMRCMYVVKETKRLENLMSSRVK